MKRHEFFNMVEGLYKYFRYFDVPGHRTIDEWHTEVKYMDSEAIPFIVSRFKLMKNLPRNIPLEMKVLYSTWERENKDNLPVAYNPVEDHRFPIWKLERAVSIYLNQDAKAFEDFCESAGMPLKDREACRFQAHMVKRGIKLDRISDKLIEGIGKRVPDLITEKGTQKDE